MTCQIGTHHKDPHHRRGSHHRGVHVCVSPHGLYPCIADRVCTRHFEDPKYFESVKMFPNDMETRF